VIKRECPGAGNLPFRQCAKFLTVPTPPKYRNCSVRRRPDPGGTNPGALDHLQVESRASPRRTWPERRCYRAKVLKRVGQQSASFTVEWTERYLLRVLTYSRVTISTGFVLRGLVGLADVSRNGHMAVNKASLLSGGLAVALLIQPMSASASSSVLNQSALSVRIWEFARQDTARSVPRRNPLLWAMEASCLLIAGCSWLALAKSQENERKKREEQRIAASLAVAVRSGLLEFGIQRSDIPVWSMWAEDETDVAPKSLILSRYRVLGYSGEIREPAADPDGLPSRTIVRPDALELVADRDLLLGIPHAFLKP
jgi:hypothetical protein